MTQPRELVAIAEAAVDDVEQMFSAGLGAAPTHFKSGDDFATDVDLAIEAKLRANLTQMTGIPVLGEERGGEPAHLDDTVWVVDPIDGTANYSAGNPMCGILVALLHEARPIVAVASFPLLHQRLVAADGMDIRALRGPLRDRSGAGDHHSSNQVGLSSHMKLEVVDDLRANGMRPRMTGSVGIDNAFVAQGVFDGAVNFSKFPWDNATGALLVKAAGGVVTDTEGNEWTAHSRGLVCGTPEVHAAIMDTISRHH